MKTSIKITALLGALASVLAPSLHAQTSTWNGGGGNASWTTGANWGGTPPAAGNALVFGGTTRLTNTNDYAAATSFNGITFNNTAGAFVLNGNQIRLTGAITNNGNGTTQTINLPIDLNGSALSVNNADGNIALGGVISGSGGITRTTATGSRALTLSGNNTYTGVTTLNGASGSGDPTLYITHNNALGATGAGNGTVVNGSAYANILGSRLQLASGVTVTDETLTLHAPDATRATLLLTGGSGGWDGNIIATGNGGGGLAIIAKDDVGNMTIGSSSADTITGNATQLVLRGSGTGTNVVNSKISVTGANGLGKTDVGTWTIASTDNDYTGFTQIAGGTLAIASIADSGVNSSIGKGSNITLQGGGVLRFTGASGGSSNRTVTFAAGAGSIENTVAGQTLTLSGGITGNVTNTFFVTGEGNTAISGNISGTGLAFLKSGNGTATLSGTNSYTRDTTVSAGTLLINGNQSGAAGNVTVSASATLGGNGTIGGAVTVANSGILAPGTVGDTTTTLTLNTKNLTISGTDSKINLDITGTAAGAFDSIAGINAFAQGGDITFTLSGTYGIASWNVFAFSSKSGNFDTITLAGSYAGTLNRVSDTWTGTVGGQGWTFEQTTGTLSVIPEPTTWALLAVSLTAITLFRRRRARI